MKFRFFNLLLVTALTLCLTNCTNLSELRKKKDYLNDFSSVLAGEYLDLSESEAELHDYFDAEYFAKKGLRAYNGEEVLPDAPNNRVLSGELYDEAMSYYSRLNESSTDEAKLRFPEQLARTQVLYECYLEELEDEGISKVSSRCRTNLQMSLPTLETMLIPEKDYYSQSHSKNYSIYFGFNKFNIDGKSLATIDEIANAVKGSNKFHVKLAGYSDPTGDPNYNKALSLKRALAVRKRLINKGIPEDNIEYSGMGELIMRNTDNRLSRRVDVEVR